MKVIRGEFIQKARNVPKLSSCGSIIVSCLSNIQLYWLWVTPVDFFLDDYQTNGTLPLADRKKKILSLPSGDLFDLHLKTRKAQEEAWNFF